MKNNPLISIILSTYNWEKYIENSILSIINQSYNNFEFIIINDCSIDNVESIILKYSRKDERIKYLKNLKNLKLAKSLNRWLKIAKWKYIARIDDDDIWEKEKLKKQINFLKKNDKYLLIWTNWIFINKKWKKIWNFSNIINNNVIKKYILSKNCFTHSSVLFKNIWEYYNENYNWVEDYELWLRLWKLWNIWNINENLVRYRILKNSITRKNIINMPLLSLLLTIKYRKYYPWFYQWLIQKIKILMISIIIFFTKKIWIYNFLKKNN